MINSDEAILPPLSSEGPWELPVIPVRGPVLFPHALAPLTVGREKSLAALEALDESQIVAVFAQRDPTVDDPELPDLFQIGCAGLVLRLARTGEDDPTVIAFIEGARRIKIREVVKTDPVLTVSVDLLHDVVPEIEDASARSVQGRRSPARLP